MVQRVGAPVTVAVIAVSLLATAAGPAGFAEEADTAQPVGQAGVDPIWSDTYTPQPDRGTFLNGIPTDDGGYLLVGRFGPEDGGGHSALAIRVDGTGAVEWVWSLQGYGHASLSGAVELDDGGFLVAGTQRTPEEGPRRLVARLTADGELVWRDTYGPGRVTDAVRAKTGGALIIGGATAGVVTPSGADVWVQQYTDAAIEAATRLEDGYVLAGANTSGAQPAREVRRIDGSGDVVWSDTRGGEGPERYTGVAVAAGLLHAVGRATLGDPAENGSVRNPATTSYHPNGSFDRGRITRRESPNETVTDGAPGDGGVVAAVRRDRGGRLMRFVPGDIVRTRSVAARLRSVTAVGDGRYLVTGDRDGDAYAALVEPSYDEPGGTSHTAGSGSGAGEAGGGDTESPAGGSDGGGGPDLPTVSVGGIPPLVTGVLVVAAALATLVAIAVTALSLRQM